MTPASPGAPEFASTSSRNLSLPTPSSPSIYESARPSTPKTNGFGSSGPQQNGLTPPSTADPLQPPLILTVSTTEEVRDPHVIVLSFSCINIDLDSLKKIRKASQYLLRFQS